MRFWDACAIVPLLMAETTTKTLQGLANSDPAMLVWWATEVECASAIARLEREGALEPSVVNEAFDRLKRLAEGWHEVDPSDGVREALYGSCASIRFALPTRSNSRPPSWPLNADHHRSRSSHSTIISLPPLAEKDSC